MIIREKLNWPTSKCCFSVSRSRQHLENNNETTQDDIQHISLLLLINLSLSHSEGKKTQKSQKNKTQCVNCMYSPSSSHRPSCSFTIKHIHSLQAGFSLEFSSQISSANTAQRRSRVPEFITDEEEMRRGYWRTCWPLLKKSGFIFIQL